MSADREALLDALRDNPDDETSLLVYADWLADHGEPDRAEYIRLQWERHGLDDDDPAWPELFAQTECHWRKNSKRWSKGMPPAVVAFLRFGGLITRLRVTAAMFVKASDALCDQPLSRVVLTAAGKKLVELMDCAALAGVRDLVLHGSRIAKDALDIFLESPYLTNLHTLRLNQASLYAPAVEILAASPLMSQLKTLDLGFYERRDGDIDNSLWRHTSLSQGGDQFNPIGENGIAALADSPHVANLETLLLAGCCFSPDGLARLAESKHLRKVRRLDLSYNQFHTADFRVFVDSPLLRGLELLELQGTQIGPAGVAALAASPNAENLKLLDLCGSRYEAPPLLDDEAARKLARSKHLARLEHLFLRQNEIGRVGASTLAKSKHLTSLRTLSLSLNPIGDHGAHALASSPHLKHLTALDLRNCQITSDGASAFLASKTFGDQLHLDLGNNLIDLEIVEALQERFGARLSIDDQDLGSLSDMDME